MEDESVTVRSTSAASADVHPLVLRPGDRTRLVFIPTLVDNEHDRDASVKATLAYQKKKLDNLWENPAAINLATLRADEGVKLSLSAEETAKLYMYLQTLYGLYDERGIRSGFRKYVLIDADDPVAQTLERIKRSDPTKSVSRVVVRG